MEEVEPSTTAEALAHIPKAVAAVEGMEAEPCIEEAAGKLVAKELVDRLVEEAVEQLCCLQ